MARPCFQHASIDDVGLQETGKWHGRDATEHRPVPRARIPAGWANISYNLQGHE